MNRNLLKIAGIVSAIVVVIMIGGFIYVLLSIDNSFWVTSRTINMKLDDRAKETFIVIDKQAIHPNSMELRMTGSLNGQGILKFGWSDSSYYRSDTINGDFNIYFERLDWYSDTCFFKFEPLSATNGDLKIECEIFSSRK
ncbi:hypothetical protein [Pontibacter virosus]|nr:hypothetical protein [Pontibacter virosus]